MKKYAFACDLKDDPELIRQYVEYHQSGKIWPQVIESIKASGIESMEIYLTGNRLFMIIETREDFDFAIKANMDEENPMVQQWEALMDQFQQRLPWAKDGEKWIVMEKIFEFESQKSNVEKSKVIGH